MKKKSLLGLFLTSITLLSLSLILSGCDNNRDYRGEMKVIAKKIYNAVTENEEEIEPVKMTYLERMENGFFTKVLKFWNQYIFEVRPK